MNENITEILNEVEITAKESLKNVINESAIGYKYYLFKEMQRLLKEKGIDWELKNTDTPGYLED